MMKYSTGWRPPICGFFFYTGLWRLYLTKMGAFFCKKHLPIVWRPEISFFGTPKFHILGTGGSFFRPFCLFKIYWVFSKFTEFIISVGEAYNSTFASLSNLPSLYWVSVNLEGPVLEPDQQKNRLSEFTESLSKDSVNLIKMQRLSCKLLPL